MLAIGMLIAVAEQNERWWRCLVFTEQVAIASGRDVFFAAFFLSAETTTTSSSCRLLVDENFLMSKYADILINALLSPHIFEDLRRRSCS